MPSRTTPVMLLSPQGASLYTNAAWTESFGEAEHEQAVAAAVAADLGDGEATIALEDGQQIHVASTPVGLVVTACAPPICPADLGEALRGLVHELNNHLHVSASVAEVLADIAQVEPEDQVLVEDLKHACQRAVNLAEQLRAIGRALSEAPQPVGLDAVLDDISLEPGRWSTGAIALSIEADAAGDCAVLAERVVLHRIVANVVVEAATCAAPGSTVMVSAEPRHGDVVLRIDALTDEPVEALESRVAQPFFAAANGRTHGGMGMTVAGLLVRALHGQIAFNSPLPRRAQWQIHLPAATA